MADPDFLLGEIRRNARFARCAATGSPSELTALREVAHYAAQLDAWMTGGGNPPSAWRPQDAVSVSGRSAPRRGYLPPSAHDVRFYGNADGSITAICLPCAGPDGRPWSTRIERDHETGAFLRCWSEHTGLTAVVVSSGGMPGGSTQEGAALPPPSSRDPA